jgi:hypothetical protein
MKVSAITGLIWLVLAATAFGQTKSSGNATSPGAPSKAALAEVRSNVHELEGHTEKLRELLANHRSLVERRPDAKGGSPELAKWEAAVARLLARIESAHEALVETTQRLDKSIAGELPTGLAKDVAKARNEAEPERLMAEQVLAKRKASPATKSKPGKQPAEKPASPSNEDLDL